MFFSVFIVGLIAVFVLFLLVVVMWMWTNSEERLVYDDEDIPEIYRNQIPTYEQLRDQREQVFLGLP
ncbi:hypothetical protein QR680_018204 [Steinernema hermaphroditum]|uniref:Uncharacterized protein n=1 Tax=Steinernema hermaphroditum TaxID=289476 RepID=A0AA39LQM4_9BILA|nr:hypothetical protein QR680_018204 [Steinernema hermaphroditum]